jgi:cysteine desulfurase
MDIDAFESAIQEDTRIASVIHASHRIGTIQPIERISAICQERDILLHTDACQSVGKINCRVDELGVDMLSLSGHKFYAPKGIGALYIRTGVPVDPIMFGEGSEAGLRPGTANVPHIVGLGQATKIIQAGLSSTSSETKHKLEQFVVHLEQALGKPVIIHGKDARRLPSILSFELPGVSADALQQMLPEICFCPTATNGNSSGKGRTLNGTHAAMGLSQEQSACTVRISFGWNTSDTEILKAAQLIATAYESLSS